MSEPNKIVVTEADLKLGSDLWSECFLPPPGFKCCTQLQQQEYLANLIATAMQPERQELDQLRKDKERLEKALTQAANRLGYYDHKLDAEIARGHLQSNSPTPKAAQ
jgi:hypothetical protein